MGFDLGGLLQRCRPDGTWETLRELHCDRDRGVFAVLGLGKGWDGEEWQSVASRDLPPDMTEERLSDFWFNACAISWLQRFEVEQYVARARGPALVCAERVLSFFGDSAVGDRFVFGFFS